ncbi:hypothetical protein QBC38DRAFT_462031 [Podospora fimiseda]|uniref:Uncharacterized protein n=1 Tax=Podospora fimiseda TaxID=252190 RepID=A0AAN6YLH9_9PEZI|nr:hypothetical protein QBC38DRAFT_462031 [Podospora fimiseda]
MLDPPKSASTYGQIIGDGQQTVTFLSAIRDLVVMPASAAWDKRRAAQTLRERLGEWATEAVDSRGRWQHPVLRGDAFEKHLIDKDGVLKPSGELISSFAWAQLLFALDIRPGGKILEWRLIHH